jgi:hypothetical protein
MAEKAPLTRKQQIDAILLQLPGVATKKIGGLDAWLVNDRMFACMNGEGLGIRLPAATARDLQFSRENVAAFQPKGMPSSPEWVQVNRADASEYGKDLELFRSSIEFVKGGR